MSNVIMAIDLGTHKSGYCVYDTDTEIFIQHGYVAAEEPEKILNALVAIAKSRQAKQIVIELSSGRHDTATTKLKRAVHNVIQRIDIPIETHTAAEWRQTLHLFSKRAERDSYKHMALKYVKENFPEIYRDSMPDDEAEAICIAVVERMGFRTHRSKKDRRNEEARQKKIFFKHEEEDEFEYDEPAEFRKLYR